MLSNRCVKSWVWSFALCLAVIPLANAAEFRAGPVWTTAPFQKSDDARKSLSGAACLPSTGHCLVVNDEQKYAEFFEISGSTISPAEVIQLLPKKVAGTEMDEIGAEGAAFANGYYYVTGSHGAARKSDKIRPSEFYVFRFAIGNDGRPAFPYSEDQLRDNPAPEIERSAKLREIIKANPNVGEFAEKPLLTNGVSIEAISVDGSTLLFGFRSPALTAETHEVAILKVNEDAIFGDAAVNANVVRLIVDAKLGVRDMAKVNDGQLLLLGPSDEEVGPASLWLWDGVSRTPVKLGVFPGLAPSSKAETVLVLSETSKAYQLLLLFDGVENGDPHEFWIEK